MTQTNSEVQVDNSSVRVTRWTLAAGDETGEHTHALDYMVVPVTAGSMLITDADGTQSTSKLTQGVSYYRQAGARHNVRNDGVEPLDFVEMELVRPAGGSEAGGSKDRPQSESGDLGYRLRHPGEADYDRWRELYQGYADFYGVQQPDELARLVWSWIQNPEHEVAALVAEAADGEVVGLAHYRPFARPLSATTGCWLDDLFVDPARRGSGAADALLGELARIAKERNWSVVRWITAEDNHRARSKYDTVATRTLWVTYDMPPAG